jgi:NADPH:quinone reductase-like Zn-dependent oxidoreductase
MKALVQTRYGPPEEVLEVREVAAPAVGEGEVLVRVRAAGAIWADCAATRGVPYMLRLVFGRGAGKQPIRGMDVAGVVESVGPGAHELQVGDEVFGWSTATFAELTAVPEDHLVPKPATLSFEQAAGVPMAGFVALQAMRDIGHVQPGQRVLINGASGGIGTFAVQIAKALGAEVTGVCSTQNVDLVRSIGADHVIDYTQEDFTQGDQRYDCILDIADNRSFAARRRVLTPRGTLIPNSGVGNRWVGSLGRVIRARLLSPFVSQSLRPFLSRENRSDLQELRRLIEEGAVRPVIGECRPLEEGGIAVGHAGGGHVRGKVVLVI